MWKYRVTVESSDPDFVTAVFELDTLEINQNRDIFPIRNALGQVVSLEPSPVFLTISGQVDPKEVPETEVGDDNGEG